MPLSARQETILTWLRKAYPNAAALFVSGLRVRDDADMPCRTRLMAHAFRELCIVINNQHSTNSRKLEPLLDSMVKEYKKLDYTPTPLGAPTGGAAPAPPDNTVSVSGAFMQSAASLVEVHGSRMSGRDRARIALQAMSGAAGIQADITPTADRWHRMYTYFVGRAHDHAADDGGTNAAELGQEVQFFEETLESFAQPAIENLDELDAILATANV